MKRQRKYHFTEQSKKNVRVSRGEEHTDIHVYKGVTRCALLDEDVVRGGTRADACRGSGWAWLGVNGTPLSTCMEEAGHWLGVWRGCRPGVRASPCILLIFPCTSAHEYWRQTAAAAAGRSSAGWPPKTPRREGSASGGEDKASTFVQEPHAPRAGSSSSSK